MGIQGMRVLEIEDEIFGKETKYKENGGGKV